MPPQRRTITTISTVLDSLRDKIHHFADTADEEQLREVAQLIDRLSISNNGPFRLLDLPYELLEYTAVRYFTYYETLPILPVNQVFNELFTSSIWKRVRFDNMKINGYDIPLDVLIRNVRRIRTVNLGLTEPDFFVSGYFHYATSISFELKDGMEKMFTLHLEQMKYLRRVSLTINDKSHGVIDAAAKWVDDNRRSGHVQQIVIKVAYTPTSRQAIPLLTSLLDKVKFKKRIRLDCASLQPFPANVISCMPATLTILSVARSTPTNCQGEINKQVFGADPKSVFVHLRTLHVQVCCNDSCLYNFQSFVPERFPVLRVLVISVPKESCNGDVDTPFRTIFSNTQWLTITDLVFIGNGIMAPEFGRLLFKAMPAVQSWTFQHMTELDISSDLDMCSAISDL
ncbi:hypothetical protein GQ42DRAFT_160269, partial [Ramicandelaber brevisporus]